MTQDLHTLERPLYQSLKHFAGTHFSKCICTISMHVLQGSCPLHRTEQLLKQMIPDTPRVPLGFRRHISIDRKIRFRDGNRLQLISQPASRSEEHTSELQSRGHLVCSLMLEKKT